MLNLSFVGRTVAVVVPYRNETRKGQNGEFSVKEIFYRVAIDRGYKITDAQGNKVKATDFYLVKFTGNAADAMNQFGTAEKVKPDGTKGWQSRHIAAFGTMETFPKEREYKKVHQIPLNGKEYNVEITDTIIETNYVIVVDRVEFLDSNPENKGTAPATSKASAKIIGEVEATEATEQPTTDADGNECPI